MEPLTPNTSAFLSYLSSTMGTGVDDSIYSNTNYDSTKNVNPASLPPSAFFPMPGRDTPEDTPPSSIEASQSPEKIIHDNRKANIYSADDSDGPTAKVKVKGAIANHKRKGGAGHHQEDEEEDDDESGSDVDDGHEDKKSHPNDKSTPAKKGGRKSLGTDDSKLSAKEKAARRKEQNRAAQKAFRERRENKVKDLEEKLAELEAKSYGTSVENENLRGILKRLQEENVALRQSAFTFTMPVNGAPQGASGTSTPMANVAPFIPAQQSKPPTSPHHNTDDSLRSIHEAPRQIPRQSPVGTTDSPDSIVSAQSRNDPVSDATGNQGPINLFDNTSNAFTAAALGLRPPVNHADSSSSTGTTQSSSDVGPTPSSSGDRTELDALWASFLQGAPQKDQNWNATGPMSFSNTQQNIMAFAGNDAKIGTPSAAGNWDKTAFRDTAFRDTAPAPVQQHAIQPQWQQQQNDPWSGMMDNNVDDFLASLIGTTPAEKETNDEDFDAQLQAILGPANASPSAAFDLSGSGNLFSPTNYLNMSPAGTSNGPSPQTNSSISSSASPESVNAFSVPVADKSYVSPKPAGEHIYVVDDNGKIIKPSDLWLSMGMQHESNLEHLVVDDLCDMMKSKATCKDGKKYLNAKDAAELLQYRGGSKDHNAYINRLEQNNALNFGHGPQQSVRK